ncbi:MAG: hypothetical protein R3D55_12275 [Chloroflexota bacterium]
MLNLKQREQKSNMGGQRPFHLLAFFIFVAAALFPYGVILDFSPKLHYLINYTLGTQLAHIIGHFGLFVAMGGGILLLFPRLRRHVWLYFGLMFLLGIVQEYLQIVTFKHYIPVFDEILDLTVDMLGAATVFYFLGHKKETGD